MTLGLNKFEPMTDERLQELILNHWNTWAPWEVVEELFAEVHRLHKMQEQRPGGVRIVHRTSSGGQDIVHVSEISSAENSQHASAES